MLLRCALARAGKRAAKPFQFGTQFTVKSVTGPHHLHSLDIARGVAALAVVLWHWQHFFFFGTQLRSDFQPDRLPLHGLLRVFYEHGSLAVSLFFSLSGFVFFWLYSSQIATGSLSLRAFFAQRFSRLYPLHAATLLVVAAAQLLYRRQTGETFVYAHNDLKHFLLNSLMLMSDSQHDVMSFNGPSWSVPVEMLLYAIFFIFCSAIQPRLLAMSAMALAGILVLGHYRPTIGSSVGSFFLGGCVMLVHADLTGNPSRAGVAKAIIASVAVIWLAVLFAASMPDTLPRISALDASPELLAVALIIVVLFPLTILALTLAESMRPSAFRLVATLTRLGPLSYSVYLIHFPLQLLIVIATTRLSIAASVFYSPIALFAFLALLIAIGLLSHYRFEMPLQRWLRTRDTTARAA